MYNIIKTIIKIITIVNFYSIASFASDDFKVYSWFLNDTNGLVTHGILQLDCSSYNKIIKSCTDPAMVFFPTSNKLSYITNDKKFYKICSKLIIKFTNKNLAGLLRARLGTVLCNLLLKNDSYSISSETTNICSFKSNKTAKRFYRVLLGDINTWFSMSNEFRKKDNEMRNASLNTIPDYANKDDSFIVKKIKFTEFQKIITKQLLHVGDRDITILNLFGLDEFSQHWMQQHSYAGSKAIDCIILEGITHRPLMMKISPRYTELNNIIFELSSVMYARELHPKLLVRIFATRDDTFSPFKVLGIEIEEKKYQLCINIAEFNLVDCIPPPEYASEYIIDLF